MNKLPFLRPQGPIYQTLDVSALKATNQETWPFFNAVAAELTPESSSKVFVQFVEFTILGLIRVPAPKTAQGELDVRPQFATSPIFAFLYQCIVALALRRS